MRPVFVSDLDGTLVLEKTISEPVVQALQLLTRKGWAIVIATGRPWREAERHLRLVNTAACAMLHGSEIVDRGKTLFSRRISGAIAREIAVELGGVGINFIYRVGETYAMFGYHRSMKRIVKQGYPAPFATGGSLLSGTIEPSVIKVEVPNAMSNYVDTLLHIHERSVRYYKKPFPDGYMYEIVAVGVDKSSAVNWIVRQLGSNMEAVCAIGDDINDFELLRDSGRSAAMPHAPSEVKNVSDEILAVSDAETLAAWITNLARE